MGFLAGYEAPWIGQTIAVCNPRRSMQMPFVNIVVYLIIVGVTLYLINRYIPMAQSIKTILNVVVVLVVCVWLLQSFGLMAGGGSVRLP